MEVGIVISIVQAESVPGIRSCIVKDCQPPTLQEQREIRHQRKLNTKLTLVLDIGLTQDLTQ